MEQQQERSTVNDVPNTKEMVRRLEETAGVAGGMLENLHLQGGILMFKNNYTSLYIIF